MPNPTPGETAYAAYLACVAPEAPWGELAWHEMSPEYQAAWEVAAEAVLVDTRRH